MATVTAAPLVSLRNILVATDFSPCSRLALQYAAELARQAQGKIFLAHVVPLEPVYPIPMDNGPGFGDLPLRDAKAELQRSLSAPELRGIEHVMLLQHGDLWPALRMMLEENHVELLVVGTHGREGVKKLVLGSVAEQVFRRASCPVLTVGPHVTPERFRDGSLRRVLFATDLSQSSARALPYVSMLAQQHQAAFTFIHVLPLSIAAGELGAAIVEPDAEMARESLRAMVPQGIRAELVIETGSPGESLVRVAKERNADLIVMGLHPHSVFAASHLPWTTAHRVVCDAPCPVMTVR